MRKIWILLLAPLALFAVPTVRRSALAPIENVFAETLQRSHMEVVALPRGVYLEGYGAVFTTDVNLTYTPTINPFRLTISKEEIDRFYQIKLKQLDVLRGDMLQVLLEAGSMLETVPVSEQIVLVVTLGNEKWENTGGLPSQVYMQAQRAKLKEAKAGRVDPKTIVKVQEL